MHFLLVSSFNCLFLLLRLSSGGPFLLSSFCCQASGGFFAWRLNNLVSAATAGDLSASGQDLPLTQPLAAMQAFRTQPGADVNLGGGFGGAPGGGMGGGGGGGAPA